MNHSHAIDHSHGTKGIFSLTSLLFRDRRRPVRSYWEDFASSQPENLTGGGGNTTGPSSPTTFVRVGLPFSCMARRPPLPPPGTVFWSRARVNIYLYIYREYSFYSLQIILHNKQRQFVSSIENCWTR